MAKDRAYYIGTDTGGTFTDITVLTEEGEIYVEKAPTTPRNFAEGVLHAVERVSERMGIPPRELLGRCRQFKHGSTIATNALITREGSRVGLITTRGFEDTTLIMRGIGRVAGLTEDEIKHQATAVKPTPLVPKDLIAGVTERIDFQGNVVIPLHAGEAEEALRYLVEEQKVESLAVNFLFSFVNPVHERKVRELFLERYGDRGLYLTLASEVCPVVREYARSNTTILNSFLGATVEGYLKGLDGRLRAGGYRRKLLVMQANGGVVHMDNLVPLGTLSSGPSGGMMASKYMADHLGHGKVITTDMGGTSFDVGFLVDGNWPYLREPVVERFHITWPMIGIESIGAGGGTIASVDEVTGRLLLGPRSAAADPGPACYGRGGTEPTVTDADLVLGILDPDYFLGGRMKLDRRRAEEAIEERVAGPLGMTVVEAAAGIFDIINGHMSDLIRKQVVASGQVPEDFVIYAYGGAGAVHAAAYARDLGVERVYVFPTSAVFSALGVATADVVHTAQRSFRYALPVEPRVLNERIGEVERELYALMRQEGFSRKAVRFRRLFFMRYRRQLNELDIEVPAKRYAAEDIRSIMAEFERKYEEVYGEGSAYQEAGIELISFQVDAIGQTAKPPLVTFPRSRSRPARAALKKGRGVYFTARKKFLPTSVYDYASLRPGNVIGGPAVLETPHTTILIPPEMGGRVDNFRNVELTWNR
ncbi:MAG: hydantoinase/oxoprolinase family protein [Candidatus Tectomicrobia bacterium]|nr:hydantoinase/oxoprolinase family protein [Candidatus Tectomicrobia bacterium]